ncbi:polyglutamate biosynthesis protein [Lophiostoma macrostomum CBS 122681]|uniref:Polyglutamate biosynthesis protein n=1 Tax=Lophiostoma macrostomum CBS 122681 TaxID=1314788 RepID=A0A6A6T9B3_9PLEO|nr:polyglutamate biosynthesis protein [Lophiostoma macrostomum CBS 122681]
MPLARFHINLVGDVMLGRLIDQLLPTHIHSPEEAVMVKKFLAENPELQAYDFTSPWNNTLHLFHSSHLNLINLETAVTTHPYAWPDKVFNYRMHPTNIQCLKEARVSYVSLANNHTLDFAGPGLLETVRTVKSAGIAFAGAGESRDEACRPAVMELKHEAESYTVHVYSASDHPRDWSSVPNFHLIGYLPSNRKRLKSLLTTTYSEPDLKIFSVHWGPNYSWTPSDDIRSLAHFLIDECGVDVIHGSSSHHIQGAEIYNGKLIIYGCGDFVDDYAVNKEYRNDLSALWRVGVEVAEEGQKRLSVKRLELFPNRIKRFQAHQLREDDPDHRWVCKTFKELCKKLGTNIRPTYGKHGQMVVDINCTYDSIPGTALHQSLPLLT